jgi:transposase
LRALVRKERFAKRAQRLRSVVLAAEGHTAAAIAQQVDLSLRQVQHWVRRYNQAGVDGLQDRPGRGPRPMLSASEGQRLQARLEAGPTPEDGVCTLRVRDVQRILEAEFGKLRRLGAVYQLLHALGYASLVPRPQHRQADAAVQEDFKKSSPSAWPRSNRPTRSSRCRSSFRMRPALGSKAR